MTSPTLEAQLVQAALELGFVRVGFAPAERSEPAAERLRAWLDAGHHGEMAYLAGPVDRADPRALLAEAKSVVVVALPYGAPPRADVVPLRRGALQGIVARYAQGEDYHRVLKERLARLAERLVELCGRPVLARSCVDSAPLLEHELAARAGLGFTAKSTLTIVPGAGSYVLLGELLVDVELEPSRAASGGCGQCDACLTACPTKAFVGPHVLDARRCISYLTIELKGAIPRELRPRIGQHVYGCDVCQDVCPWNQSRHVPAPDHQLAPRPALRAPDLVELLFLTSGDYRRLVRGTAMMRVSRSRLARNAAVALGNSRDPRAEAPLVRALREHPSDLVREHAAWALGELGVSLEGDGAAALRHAIARDLSSEVRQEALRALERVESLTAAPSAGAR